MKKILMVTITLLLGITLSSQSQDIEIGGSVGYMMSGQVYLIEGDADITNNVAYGGFTHFHISDGILLELLYLRKDTKVDYINFYQNIRDTYKMSVEYYHIGGIKTFGTKEDVKPFVSFSMGATRFHLKENTGYDDSWKFSIAPSVGFIYYMSDKVGLKTQARLLMPLTFDGFGIFWSSSSGGSTGFSFEVPVWQGDFSGSVFIRL